MLLRKQLLTMYSRIFISAYSSWLLHRQWDNRITVTSLWTRWRLKSPASRLFAQSFVQVQMNAIIKVPRQWHLGGIHRWPVDSPHKGPVTQKMFPFNDVIMVWFLRIYCVKQLGLRRFRLYLSKYWPLGTNFSNILIKVSQFSIMKMRFKVSSSKVAAILSWPQCAKSDTVPLIRHCTCRWQVFIRNTQ